MGKHRFLCSLFTVFFVMSLLQQRFITTSGITTEKESSCDLPFVKGGFFEDIEYPDPNAKLEYITSNKTEGDTIKVIPFQFLVMNCSASYPIEWVTDIQQPYYFSYILDEEVRVVGPATNINSLNPNNERPFSQETFTTRLHIGNDTLYKYNKNEIVAVCQPVRDTDSDDTRNECGKVIVSVLEFINDESSYLRVHFETVPSILNNDLNQTLKESYSHRRKKLKTAPLHESGETKDFVCELPLTNPIRFLSEPPSPSNESSSYSEGAYHGPYWYESECWKNEFPCPDEAASFLSNATYKSEFIANLRRPSGLLPCKETNTTEGEQQQLVPYFLSLPQLCPDEDPTLPHLYLSTQNATSVKEDEFLSVCLGGFDNGSLEKYNLDHKFYVGDNFTINCTSSIYYFARGMRMVLGIGTESKNLSRVNKLKYIDVSDHLDSGQAYGPMGYRVISGTFMIKNESFSTLQCKAPVRKSRKWVTKSIKLNVKKPVDISFQGDPDTEFTITDEGPDKTYFICNASGDPLPTLSWSRVNNGRIPTNQTVNWDRSKSPLWISSTLHFSNINRSTGINNLTEYYGRYVCSAKNKFEGLDKFFTLVSRPPKVSVFVGESSINASWIAIGTISVAVVISFVCISIMFIYRRRSRQVGERLISKEEVDEFFEGNRELLSAAIVNRAENLYAYHKYKKEKYEVERKYLDYDNKIILGKGEFGIVYQGKYKYKIKKDNNEEEEKVRMVAIKTLHSSSHDKIHLDALLDEIKIMSFIEGHENIVEFIGACTKDIYQGQVLMVTEYCPEGDLLKYIRNHQEKFKADLINFDANDTTTSNGGNGYCQLSIAVKPTSEKQLLRWALQIANGMEFVSSKKVIHGDLAARNVLLTANLTAKIADFGLSFKLQNYAIYMKKNDAALPFRWLAIESLKHLKFSSKSDVWAFGVVLYEMFSLGQVPFPSFHYDEKFIAALENGLRLQKPNYASDTLYDLMKDCWKLERDDRPSFSEIQKRLSSLMSQLDSSEESTLTGSQFGNSSNCHSGVEKAGSSSSSLLKESARALNSEQLNGNMVGTTTQAGRKNESVLMPVVETTVYVNMSPKLNGVPRQAACQL